MRDSNWITSSDLAEALVSAGVPSGQIVMVHARLSAFPWIVGGVEAVVRALLDAVGPQGTITAYAGWEDNPYHLDEWSPARQAAYRTGMPPFDPAVSEARRNHGRLPERIRTWQVPTEASIPKRTWWLSALAPDG